MEQSDLKLGVVAVLQNEQRLAGEFIAHHLGLGIQRIHLFDAKSTDLTRLTIERVGKFYPGVTVETWDGNQDDAFRKALDMFRDEVEWLLAVTCDEFLVSPDGGDLATFLQQMEGCAAIGLHRAYFGSSGLAAAPDDILTASLVRRAPDIYGPNRHVKSLVRTRRMRGVHNAHMFISDGAPYFNCRGEEIQWIHAGLTATLPVLSPFRLNHYFGRFPTSATDAAAGQTGAAPAQDDWNADDYNSILDMSALRYAPRTREIMARIGTGSDEQQARRKPNGFLARALNIFRKSDKPPAVHDDSEAPDAPTEKEKLISNFDVCLDLVGGAPMIGDSLCVLPLALELARIYRRKVTLTGSYSKLIKPLMRGLPIGFEDAPAPGRIQFNAVLSEANNFARSNDMHIAQAFFVLAKIAPPPLPIAVPFATEPCGLPPGVVLCPFTTSDGQHVKRWYADRWMAVIDALARAGKAPITYLVGGEGEQFESYQHPAVRPLRGKPLPFILDVMHNASLVMTVDTGPSHLAHFGNVSRHLLLYPAVNPPRLGTNPRGKFIHGWPADITPETVIAEAMKILG